MRTFASLLLCAAMLLWSSPAAARRGYDARDATVEGLISTLAHADPEWRERAVEELGDRRVAQVADQMAGIAHSDSDGRVRRAALKALERISVPHLVPAAESTVLEDMDPDNRRLALTLLLEHATPKSAGIVTQALESDPDVDVQRRAAKVLRKMRWPGTEPVLVVALLHHGDREVRVLCAEALILGGKAETRKVVRDLVLSEADEKVRREIADRISDKPTTEDKDSLIAWLRHQDDDVARRAAKGLGRLRDPSAVPAMHEARPHVGRKVADEIEEAIEDIEK